MTKKRKQQLSRIKSFIRRAEKRGYVFDDDFKQSINEKTTRALQFLTPRKLYEKATFTIGSQQVPGLRGRAIERERAARKGVKTRKEKQGEYIPHINNLIYWNIIELINTYPTSPAAEYLKNLLKSEIDNYGYDVVISSLAEIGEDFIKRANDILHYQGDSMMIHDSLVTFSEILRSGEKMSKQERKELNNVSEIL